MKNILILENTIQPYAWGSHSAIAEILGQPVPSDGPQAELWMGAHPKAPSKVVVDGKYQDLRQIIHADPDRILGRKTAERFGGNLPFLFKVLAAARPLSIQAHPDEKQAKAGFARENELKLPLGAPERNYRDDNHKPECICALTRFWALRGFRSIPEILGFFTPLKTRTVVTLVRELKLRQDAGGLRRFFTGIMGMTPQERNALITELMSHGEKLKDASPEWDWILKLQREYPGDVGVLGPLLLNLICLEPGEAMFLAAGELHAYLDGAGIELMANSDNVIRGGLTSKHVDVDELLAVLNFDQAPVTVFQPVSIRSCERRYPVDLAEFELSVISTDSECVYTCDDHTGPAILLCTGGAGAIQSGNQTIAINRGTSLLIPDVTASYRIAGDCVLYKAGIGRV
ncbi:MAG: mannose-6-phosphate isomerase, class I [Desulfobacteraceae bacterium]|nr:mannose-6-phosphate isomerase, class I [Desulfobacteraceae bacterium]